MSVRDVSHTPKLGWHVFSALFDLATQFAFVLAFAGMDHDAYRLAFLEAVR